MALFDNWLNQKPKTSTEMLENMTVDQQMATRDVYDMQQIERGSLGTELSYTGVDIGAGAIAVFTAWVLWVLCSGVEMLQDILWGSRGGVSFVNPQSLGFGHYLRPDPIKFLIVLVGTGIAFTISDVVFRRRIDAENASRNGADINQYKNDQHIAVPLELMTKFDFFPDVGATSDVVFSSMISHVALMNKGIKTVQVAKRATKDILDEDGEVALYKGEILRDDDGNPIMEEKPMFDIDFMESLFDASGLPRNKKLRIYYDPTQIKYNVGNENREKLKPKKGSKYEAYNTVADLINDDWQLPIYEPQRPGGAYLVDTAPVNTMVYQPALHVA